MRMTMRIVASAAMVAGLASAAGAAELKDMVGKWKWTDYTVECKEGGANGVSCLVADGPKNKGMEMIRSKLEKKGEEFVGQVAHPATGDVYITKMTMKSADAWAMDGCTDKGVCAKGDFARIK